MSDSRLTLFALGHYLKINAPVAQLDRVSASEAEGHRFESCRVRQNFARARMDVPRPSTVRQITIVTFVLALKRSHDFAFSVTGA